MGELPRSKLHVELDAYYARLYGLPRNELRFMLSCTLLVHLIVTVGLNSRSTDGDKGCITN